jgi:hypothetical protein
LVNNSFIHSALNHPLSDKSFPVNGFSACLIKITVLFGLKVIRDNADWNKFIQKKILIDINMKDL